nr:phenoloxidase-activating factor 3-like [Aedes albopictus]
MMDQVYRVIFLLLMVLVLQCSAINSCFRDEVCVPVRYCPDIRDVIQPEPVYRNRAWKEYRWCHQQSGEELRVCCGQESTSVGKRCFTAESQKARCVDPEHCTLAGRFRRGSMQRNASYASDEDVCYHSDADGKDFYCCPDAYVNEPQKDQTPREREKRSLKVENALPSCNRTDGFTGHCVPMSLCDRFGALVLDRIPNLKYETLPDAYKCPSDASDSTSMCCAHPGTPHDFIRHAKAKKLHPENCGLIRTPDLVLGGDEAGLGEFPWMANLMGLRDSIKTAVCTGTLIHARYILTAAHCFTLPIKPISVRLGEHNLSTEEDCVENDCVKYVEYAIANWTSHAKFKRTPGLYDIALVKLDQPAEIIMDRVYPICLPVTQEWLMMKPAELIAPAWGLTEDGRDPDVLRFTTMHTLRERPYYCKQEQMICARGSNGKTHGRGDGGGPLQQAVRYGEQYRMVQFGLISGGTGKRTVDDEAVEVSVLVGYHIKWILHNMDI